MHPGKCYCEVLIVRIQVTLVVHVKRPLRGTLFRVARRGFVWRERSETSSQTSANLPIWVVEVGRPWLPLLYVFPNHENLLVCLGGSRWVDFFRGNLSSSIWVKCGPGTGQWCLVCKGSWSFLLGLQRKLVWLLGEGCPTVVSLCWLWKVPFTSYPRKFAVVLHFISVPSLGLCQERPVFWTRSSSSIFLSCLNGAIRWHICPEFIHLLQELHNSGWFRSFGYYYSCWVYLWSSQLLSFVSSLSEFIACWAIILLDFSSWHCVSFCKGPCMLFFSVYTLELEIFVGSSFWDEIEFSPLLEDAGESWIRCIKPVPVIVTKCCNELECALVQDWEEKIWRHFKIKVKWPWVQTRLGLIIRISRRPTRPKSQEWVVEMHDGVFLLTSLLRCALSVVRMLALYVRVISGHPELPRLVILFWSILTSLFNSATGRADSNTSTAIEDHFCKGIDRNQGDQSPAVSRSRYGRLNLKAEAWAPFVRTKLESDQRLS